MNILVMYYGMFSTIDHVLGYETSMNQLKRVKIIQNTFSDNSGIKLDISDRGNVRLLNV